MYYLFVIGRAIALLLPRSFSYRLGKALALAQYYLSKKDRDAVFYNFSPIIQNRKKLQVCVKQVFINFSYYLVDFFRYSRLTPQFINRYVKISGLEYLEGALKNNKGAVIASAHLGNYELGGAIIAMLGYPFHVIALPHADKRLNNFFISQRSLTGLKVVSTGIPVKHCFNTLRKGEIIGILGDRDFARDGLPVEMFSRKTTLPRGTAFFALKTGAAIIPTFFVRENKRYYRLIIEKPIEYNKEDCLVQEKIIKAYAAILEKYISLYPEQWYMFEKYWQ
ncbi:MAG: lysophospholipid acyltransferase family protein [Candidatus Omnitrophica bacterium]|nr:lysophospholipid acyltransferase family protein [Candidatus Omnitrophota bacterium]